MGSKRFWSSVVISGLAAAAAFYIVTHLQKKSPATTPAAPAPGTTPPIIGANAINFTGPEYRPLTREKMHTHAEIIARRHNGI